MRPSSNPHAIAYESAVRGVPRGPGPRRLRVHRPAEAACLIGSGLHRMQLLASFEPLKFRSEGCRHLDPRSRTGARPRQGAWRSDLISTTIQRDGRSSALPCAAERIFMRRHNM
jgi:hypothetical protein